MAQEIINIGAAPNDGEGDPIRTSFQKTNTNFTELYNNFQTSAPSTLIGASGDVPGMIAYDTSGEYFYFCFNDFDGTSTIWRQVPNAAQANIASLTVSGDAEIDGNLQFSSQDAPETFIPYDQLTEATVIGWVDASNQLPNMQACVQGQIDSMITPPVSPANTALPWSA